MVYSVMKKIISYIMLIYPLILIIIQIIRIYNSGEITYYFYYNVAFMFVISIIAFISLRSKQIGYWQYINTLFAYIASISLQYPILISIMFLLFAFGVYKTYNTDSKLLKYTIWMSSIVCGLYVFKENTISINYLINLSLLYTCILICYCLLVIGEENVR